LKKALKKFAKAALMVPQMDGDRFTGEVLVRFPSVEAAERALEKGATVGGKALTVTWAGVCPTAILHLPKRCTNTNECPFCPSTKIRHLSAHVFGSY